MHVESLTRRFQEVLVIPPSTTSLSGHEGTGFIYEIGRSVATRKPDATACVNAVVPVAATLTWERGSHHEVIPSLTLGDDSEAVHSTGPLISREPPAWLNTMSMGPRDTVKGECGW